MGSSMNDLYLGIDVGTTGTKAAVYDCSGRQLGAGYVSYAVSSGERGRYLQDARDWRRATATATRAAISDLDPQRVVSLAVSAQGGTLVAVDEQGEPVVPARSWLDRRAEPEAQTLRALFGEREFYEHTGWPIAPNNTCAQILALAREEPAQFKRTALFLETASYLNLWLAGVPIIDTNIAGITQLLDVAKEQWSAQVLELAGIDALRLPRLARPGQLIGGLTADAGTELGLRSGTLVVAGGHDQYCAALGAGVVDDGDMLLSTGTAWVVLAISHDVSCGHQSGFSFGRHLVPNLWGHFAEVPNGGISMEWILRLWSDEAAGRPFDIAELEQLVSGAGPGSDGVLFLPHFDGTEPRDMSSSSHGTFIGLELSNDRRHLTRAVMEGVALGAASLIRAYREIDPSRGPITVTGGATHSATWIQIVADVLGEEIDVSDTAHAACRGAAALAAAGAGAFGTVSAAADRMSASTTRVSPDETATRAYHRLARRYELAEHALADMYRELRRLDSAEDGVAQ
jgi:sugar (pentulose or hexulose) kinase